MLSALYFLRDLCRHSGNAALLGLILLCAPAAAQTPDQTPDQTPVEPLEITADGVLEWDREAQILIARDDARAKRGDSEITADVLSAAYAENAASEFDISRLEAAGNVVITTRDSRAYGENAVYDLPSETATMTGGDLRIETPDQTLRARDQFIYRVEAGELRALGNAVLTRPKPDGTGKDTLEAREIRAQFTQNSEGDRILDRIEAYDNVVITTPTETITGSYGEYRSADNMAEIRGGVTIRRGPNILQGARATVDLSTNQSRLFGGRASPDSAGRVRGVFYPDSENGPVP